MSDVFERNTPSTSNLFSDMRNLEHLNDSDSILTFPVSRNKMAKIKTRSHIKPMNSNKKNFF